MICVSVPSDPSEIRCQTGNRSAWFAGRSNQWDDDAPLTGGALTLRPM